MISTPSRSAITSSFTAWNAASSGIPATATIATAPISAPPGRSSFRIASCRLAITRYVKQNTTSAAVIELLSRRYAGSAPAGGGVSARHRARRSPAGSG